MAKSAGKVIPFRRRREVEEPLPEPEGWAHLAEIGPPPAGRGEFPASVLSVELRGWERLQEASGPADADAVIRRCLEGATKVVSDHAADESMVEGSAAEPIVSATFAGEDHALRALRAAAAIRTRVEEAQSEAPEHARMEACAGVNSGFVVEVKMGDDDPASYLAIGALRTLASRLREFAGEGDVFLSIETYAVAGADIRAVPIGDVRMDDWGEKRDAFRLTAVRTGRHAGLLSQLRARPWHPSIVRPNGPYDPSSAPGSSARSRT